MAYDNMTSRAGTQPLVKEQTVSMLLTPEERDMILTMRKADKKEDSKESNAAMNKLVRGN